MRPVIGVTMSISEDESICQMARCYTEALIHAGALPVLLPLTLEASVISAYADRIDGLLLSGGGDVDPIRYGANQEWTCGEVSPLRDRFEIALFHAVMSLGTKPVLGICRGIQLMNVALGGTLYQNLASDYPASLAHRQKQRSCYASHEIRMEKNCLLQHIFGQEMLVGNSHHHQALKETPACFQPVAFAPDGVIEAAEHRTHPFCIGVQWHPERLWDQPDTRSHGKLFDAFVSACRKT